jgi:hypothetical protein
MGRRSIGVVGDVGNMDDGERMVTEGLDRFGRLDILVNNAGSPVGADREWTWKVPEEAWDEVLRINTKGTFLMSSSFTRHRLEQAELVAVPRATNHLPLEPILQVRRVVARHYGAGYGTTTDRGKPVGADSANCPPCAVASSVDANFHLAHNDDLELADGEFLGVANIDARGRSGNCVCHSRNIHSPLARISARVCSSLGCGPATRSRRRCMTVGKFPTRRLAPDSVQVRSPAPPGRSGRTRVMTKWHSGPRR